MFSGQVSLPSWVRLPVRLKLLLVLTLACSILAGWHIVRNRSVLAESSTQPMANGTLQAEGELACVAVGHEYREDDLPSVAVASDGSVWIAWLSFEGTRDDLAIRHWDGTKWSNLHWVPGTSGDSWLPQVAVDDSNRVWIVWSQRVNENWDIYARRFDPGRQTWGALERLSKDPLPDINPRIWSDTKGRAALVWQGFRGRNSNIFLKMLEADGWSRKYGLRTTRRTIGNPPWP